MRFLKWFFGILIALILIIVIGGFIFLKTFDLNTYKPMIEKIASEKLGRKLELKGDAYLGISFIPTIIINDISLANPDWAAHKEMVTADSVTVQISLLPLLKKQVVIDEVKLVKPEIYVEVAKDGKASWDFDFPKPEELKTQTSQSGWLISSAYAAELQPEVSENDLRKILTDIFVREITIENGIVNYQDHKSGNAINLSINSFSFSMEGFSNPIEMAWDLVYNQIETSGTGSFGSINALYDKKVPYPVDAKLKAMGISADLKATVLDAMGGNPKVDFNLIATNPSGNMGAPAVNLNANGKADMKNVSVNIVKLDLAKNIISGTVSADISGKLPYVKADLRSEMINVETLLPASKTSLNLPSIVSTANASEYVPNDAIPFDLLNLANADLKVFIKKLVVNQGISASDVDLNLGLKNGIMNIKPLTLNFGSGHVDINSTINANNHSAALKLSSDGIVLQDFSKDLIPATNDDFGVISGGQTIASIDVSGSGSTYRQLVNNLSGPVIVILDQSIIQSGNIKYFTNNIFTQILNLLKINTTKQEKFDLKCAVVRADIQNGVINFPKGIAIDTKKLTVVSSGTVNLINDKLDLSLNAYGSGKADVSVTQALTGLIKIAGTLQSPSVGIDTSGALMTAASMAFGGPVGVGANLLLDKDPAPCYTALQKTPFANHFEKPTGVVATTQGVYKGTTNAIGSGVNAITGTVGTGVNAAAGAVGSGVGAVATGAKDTAKSIERGVRDVRDSLKNLLKQ